MQKHTKNYFRYFGIQFDPSGYHDYIACEVCETRANDIHHIERRMKGVNELDEIDNLIALCRDCHNKAHAGEISKTELKEIHRKTMNNKSFNN